MYLAIDIGGTKTLVADFDANGKIIQKVKFQTPKTYSSFLKILELNDANFSTARIKHICVAVPGKIDRINGIGIALGNLRWKNFSIQYDLEKLYSIPVIVENDAKLAGLSEAKLIINDFKKLLYITISTGIGTSVINNGIIDQSYIDSEGGQILLEHDDILQKWEEFASGRAIFNRWGKRASDITDQKIWKEIARNISVGLFDLLAVIQPEVVVIGGGVGTHLAKYKQFLIKELTKYKNPLVKIPPIIKAKRTEEAVIYGCYDLIKYNHG